MAHDGVVLGKTLSATAIAETKTRPIEANVADYFAAIDDDLRRKDCEALWRREG